MPNGGYPGINRLSRVMIDHANSHLPEKATRDWADFGTIQSDGSLLPDNFPQSFPLGSYAVAEPYLPPLTTPEIWGATDPSGTPVHTHTISRPDLFRVLQADDRVLIVYANDTDPVVVSRIKWGY